MSYPPVDDVALVRRSPPSTLPTGGLFSSRLETNFLKVYSAEIWNDLGSYLIWSNKPQEASKAFQNALKLDPDFQSALRSLADCYRQTNERDKALEVHRHLADLSDDPSDWNVLGCHYFESHKYRQADDCFRRALFGCTTSKIFLYNYGLSRERLGFLLDAYDAYAGSHLADRSYSLPKNSLERIHQALQEHEQHVDTARRRYPPGTVQSRYLNPFHLLNIDRADLDTLDEKILQRQRKRTLQQIELEGGILPWIPNRAVDLSEAYQILDELEDENKRAHHASLYSHPALLNFLTCGDLSLFSIHVPTQLRNSLDEDFLEFISPYFAEIYDRLY